MHVASKKPFTFLITLLILRTASNFTMQPPSLSAADNLKLESSGDGYAAMNAAIEAAYRVSSQVTDYIFKHWNEVQHSIPKAR